jgi:two-component system, OmpR family, alkaline phosphatase synthesis response regulator PhoP
MMKDKLRILIVDADQLMRSVLRRIIEAELRCIEVYVAMDQEEALKQYQTRGTDMLISDTYLPLLSCVALVQELRALDAALPIIFLSADPATSRLAHAAGASYILEKPFRVDDLRVALEVFMPQQKYRQHGSSEL